MVPTTLFIFLIAFIGGTIFGIINNVIGVAVISAILATVALMVLIVEES